MIAIVLVPKGSLWYARSTLERFECSTRKEKSAAVSRKKFAVSLSLRTANGADE